MVLLTSLILLSVTQGKKFEKGCYKTLSNVFQQKKNTLNKKWELSHCVSHTVHSKTVLFFPINIIFRIIMYLFSQNKQEMPLTL